jgi:uncharacterized protein
MALGSLLALLDDITTILDDVSVMTKIAAKKTAGVLGDDLALNAQQVTGVSADRELPVVWAVAKGSFINKLILVPAALAISYFLPWAITPLLMLGGTYLCFEGFEKIMHTLMHDPEDDLHTQEIHHAVQDKSINLVELEKDKIKGAIRTDFILSAEIIVIALGTVAEANFIKQITVVSLIAITMTAGVYGLVAGIVKLDDLGLHLMQKKGQNTVRNMQRALGQKLLSATPYLMRTLSVLGTAAMFLVGGSIISHGVPYLHHLNDNIADLLAKVPNIGSFITLISPIILNAVLGLLIGALTVGIFTGVNKIVRKKV